MISSFEKRLRKLEKERAAKSGGNFPFIDVFFAPDDCEDIEAFGRDCRSSATKGRTPVVIHFVGPAGGPELGTGPLNPEETEEYLKGSKHDEDA